MRDPLVSVVLPVRNGERFLAEAIESVLEQTYRRRELIVVDGQSTDRSAEIARSYDVRYIEQAGLAAVAEGWPGLPDAWNQGIEHGRGALICFISSDDRWTPDKLARQVDLMMSAPHLAFTIAHFRFFLEPGCALPRGFNPALLERDLVGRIPETLMVRRETFETVGRFSCDYLAAQDVDWFVRAREAGVPMSVVPRTLLHKRVHDRNLSSDAAVNTPALLQLLGDSIRRRRGNGGTA